MPSFLYIEDDSLSRQVMEVILTRVIGFTEVTIFEDSTNYTERILALSAIPDVIFLDIHLQPHGGIDILKTLRADTRYSQTRIIAVTASVMNEEVASLRNVGFDGCIGKPLNYATFPHLVNQILHGESIWNPI